MPIKCLFNYYYSIFGVSIVSKDKQAVCACTWSDQDFAEFLLVKVSLDLIVPNVTQWLLVTRNRSQWMIFSEVIIVVNGF